MPLDASGKSTLPLLVIVFEKKLEASYFFIWAFLLGWCWYPPPNWNLHCNKQTERYIVRDPFTLILELVTTPLEDSEIFFFFIHCKVEPHRLGSF